MTPDEVPARGRELSKLLSALGREPDEKLSICFNGAAGFQSRLTTVALAGDLARPYLNGHLWFGTQPLHERVVSGRGKAQDIVGLRDLTCDLDVKPGGMPTWEAAEAVIKDLSELLGVDPVAVVRTGHGLQPHWAIERDADTDWPDETDPRWLDAVVLWKQWGRLVAAVAARRGGQADSVFDLSRVMRAPGSINCKDPANPVAVRTEFLDGAPLRLSRLREVCQDEGAPVQAEDREVMGEVVAPSASWAFGAKTSNYVTAVVTGWAMDEPPARHNWLVAQSVRLAAAHRLGYITEADHAVAIKALTNRFRCVLVNTPARAETVNEMADALTWGIRRVEAMTEDRARQELGSKDPHQHGHMAGVISSDGLKEAEGSTTMEMVDQWEPPLPLTSTPVPAFPFDALPPVLHDWTLATAEHTQTPPDLPGILALLAMATAAAGKYRVEVLPGWYEPLNLYGVIALPPGTRKSPVFKSAMEPLRDAERHLVQQHAPAVVEAQGRRRVLEKAREKAERSAADKLGDVAATANAVAAALALADHVVPPMPRLLADDITPEALVDRLADHRQLGLLSEEGGIFETLGGRYSGGVANLDGVLKAYDGGSIRVDRKGDQPRHVEHAALTLGLTVQPAVLAGMAKVPDFTGRGLVARFLYAVPDASRNMGRRNIDAQPVPDDVDVRYQVLVATLALKPVPTMPQVLRFSSVAAEAFRTFREGLEPRRNPDLGDLADIVDWSNKLEGQAARIAGLLHLARHDEAVPVVIDVADVASAIRIAEYAIPHARAAHDLMAGRSVNAPAESLLRVIANKKLDSFTASSLHKLVQGQTAFRKIDGVNLALGTLVDSGYVKRLPEVATGRQGRPTSPTYRVNPIWSATEMP